MREHDVLRVREHQAGKIAIVDTNIVDQAVLDGDVLIDQPCLAGAQGGQGNVPARVMGLGLNSADHDGAAGGLREYATNHVDSVRPQPYFRQMSVVVISDAKANAAQRDEAITDERHSLGRRHLNRTRHLVPGRPGGFKFRVLGSWSDNQGTRLLIGIAVRRVRPKPAGVREREALKRQIVDLLVVAATADCDQDLKLRQLDIGLAHVLPCQRFVVKGACRRILVPFASLIQELEGVLQVGRPLPKRALEVVVAPGVLLPGRLHHRDGAVGDALHRRVAISEGTDGVQVDALGVCESVQQAQAAAEKARPLVLLVKSARLIL